MKKLIRRPEQVFFVDAIGRWIETAREAADPRGGWRYDEAKRFYRPIPALEPGDGFTTLTTFIIEEAVALVAGFDASPIRRVYDSLLASGREVDGKKLSADLEEACRSLATIRDEIVGSARPADPKDAPEKGMGWKEARIKAEALVKKQGGAWSSVARLAGAVGCSRPTVDKVIRNSAYLKARIAESGKRCREISMTVALMDGTAQAIEADPGHLAQLIEEQKADAARDGRKAPR